MNQAGLSTAAAFFLYAGVSFAVAIVAMATMAGTWAELGGDRLRVGLQAGVLNVVAVLAFTYMLAHATAAETPRYILIAGTVQTALTGVWTAYQGGIFELRIVLGLMTALATVALLRGRG
jgi:hypothetical protein